MGKRIFLTGGAGFIGSAFVRNAIKNTENTIFNFDALKYSGNLASIPESVESSERYHFAKLDLCDEPAVNSAIETFKPDWIVHMAAESHVDRSIEAPSAFIQTNILGTFHLLQASLTYWSGLDQSAKNEFRFLHVSTDEVYGSLEETEEAFTNLSSYRPRSPYSASKASSDHLVRAWHETYGLPVFVTNCSNNYGPYQFPEKLIPHLILCCLSGKRLPIYGTGNQIRDWLHVDDHINALGLVLEKGRVGETYLIGGDNQIANIQVAHLICDVMDRLAPAPESYRELISFVKDAT